MTLVGGARLVRGHSSVAKVRMVALDRVEEVAQENQRQQVVAVTNLGIHLLISSLQTHGLPDLHDTATQPKEIYPYATKIPRETVVQVV